MLFFRVIEIEVKIGYGRPGKCGSMDFSSFDSSGTALTISLELSIRMY